MLGSFFGVRVAIAQMMIVLGKGTNGSPYIPISEHTLRKCAIGVSFQKSAGLPSDVHAAFLLWPCDSLVVRAICVSGFNM